MKFGISDKTYALMLKAFSKDSSIIEVKLFGSRAMGNYKKGSDINLSVKTKTGKNNLFLSTELNQILPIPYYFDVLNFNNLSNQALKEHINTYGEIIYTHK